MVLFYAVIFFCSSAQTVTVEAFQARPAQNWSHPLLTDNAVISDLCDKERRRGEGGTHCAIISENCSQIVHCLNNFKHQKVSKVYFLLVMKLNSVNIK